MSVTCALGIDPGFATVGYAVMELGMASDRVVRMGVFETKKDNAKRRTLASDDNLRRCQELTELLSEMIQQHHVVVLCAEAMSFPRNAAAASKVAMFWGVIGALSHLHKLPIVQCSPQAMKKMLCGKRDASKEEVQEVLIREFSYLPALLTTLAKSKHEHAYDALGAIRGVRDSDVLRLARRLL